jgi:hypothetical protein
MKRVLSALAVLLATAHTAAALSKCLERDGRCMAVSVNGQQGVKLSKRTKGLLKDLEPGAPNQTAYEMRQTRYEVPVPIRGPLQIAAERSSDSGDWFGEGRSFETMVVPLDQVDLKATQQLSTADGVRVNGSAPLVVENVLEGNRLPAGRYLLIVTLSGRGNWDRMTLYVEVAE